MRSLATLEERAFSPYNAHSMNDSTLKSTLLWSDTALVVVNKPAGILSLPDGHDPSRPHLRALLEPHLGRLWIVHRLDRQTSGVMVLARDRDVHRSLSLQFQRRQAQKSYHAIVVGRPPWSEIAVRLALRPNVGRRKRTAVDPRRGKEAITRLRVLKDLVGAALVEAIPQTGRRHQIRAHLAAMGFPIMADPLYGPQDAYPDPPIARLALHAHQLRIIHPRSGLPHTFQAPYPADFLQALATLTP